MKNSASALEFIWLQCCLPSQLNGWFIFIDERGVAGEDKIDSGKAELTKVGIFASSFL